MGSAYALIQEKATMRPEARSENCAPPLCPGVGTETVAPAAKTCLAPVYIYIHQQPTNRKASVTSFH